MIEVLNAGVALLVVGLALWTVVVRDTFAAAIGFVAYGLLLTLALLAAFASVAFVRYAAEDGEPGEREQ